jgi:hypothetical protein
MIPSEINFAVEDKETAFKIEKQKNPEIPFLLLHFNFSFQMF